MKKLPSVFANKIDKQINNNEKVYYSFNNNENIKNTEEKKIENNNLNIKQKINKIFSSSNYVYKVDVEIKTKDSTFIKKIIGRNSKNLITIDNELIPIDSIIDISLSN